MNLRFHFLSTDLIKIARYVTFLSISHQILFCTSSDKKSWAIRFLKVPRQTNAYVSNKWPLKLPCAYLNTQGSSPSDTPLKRIDDG
ncbi:hypothetical protein T12_6605 [Trichinella patagoniensis]|uniref:Uncharacterized protein n=1 Tax=Trichinella patagoniensis TaxID=990121 RepID=A0A0V0ZP03_9BILA|nr:hypothetical protein T12_6605 [Trichinella patagoniensis]